MGKGKKRGSAPFFQSANVVSLRDKFYYLGPGVKHRGDTLFFLFLNKLQT